MADSYSTDHDPIRFGPVRDGIPFNSLGALARLREESGHIRLPIDSLNAYVLVSDLIDEIERLRNVSAEAARPRRFQQPRLKKG